MPQFVRRFFAHLLDRHRDEVMERYFASTRGHTSPRRTGFGRKVDERAVRLALCLKQKWAERLRERANGSR
jgi:hypothetical protein